MYWKILSGVFGILDKRGQISTIFRQQILAIFEERAVDRLWLVHPQPHSNLKETRLDS